ncbi:MAG: hypothetical protein EXS13_00315 [Planctomycetes bacterium]|nr:hypothetical protein [Planctomycetota bacterium]
MTLPLERLKTYALSERPSLVSKEGFARVEVPPPGAVAALLGALPDVLGARALRQLARALLDARRAKAPIALGIGAHVLKVGLSPLLVDLMERGFVQALATNGAGAIHDVELAMIGATSEDVASALKDGSFGMARDTAEFLNGAVRAGVADGLGFGAAVGRAIDRAALPHRELSVLWHCFRRGLPGTVHVTLGADIVHMHASADGASIGAASLADFRRFAELVATLQGGAYVNVGSAVTLPEVFLKALAIARNLGATVDRFTTANLDQLSHYRPRMNVLDRPAAGPSFDLRGHHEILLPLLRWLLIDPPADWVQDTAKGTR